MKRHLLLLALTGLVSPAFSAEHKYSPQVDFGTLTSDGIAIGKADPDYNLDLFSSGASGAGVIGRDLNILRTGLVVPTNAVYFGMYSQVTSADTIDHTGDAAHFGAGVFRTSDVSGGRTDSITLESRNDARTNVSGVESTSLLAYMDAVGAGTMSGSYYALRVRPCISTDGDCATDNNTGTLAGIYLENVQGGAVGTNYALYQEGSDDFNIMLASSTKLGTSTTSRIGKLDIVQAGGAGIIPALRLEGGGSSNDVIVSLGRNTLYEQGIFVAGANGNWFTGSLAGDLSLQSLSTSNQIALSVGLNAVPEALVTNGRVNIGGALKLIPQASPPSSPASGDMYMDSSPSPDELCVYDGAAWQALISGTDGNCA